MIQRARKPNHVYLHSDTNKPIRAETKYICTETGKELMLSDMKFAYEYGGERVNFDAEELRTIKKIAPQGLKILGFKPSSKLKLYHNMRPSSFIYPNDHSITGSTTAFAALHKKMIEMEKVAICRMVTREGQIPNYVALVPQMEEVDDNDGTQITPPGFNVIYLPFADGLRKLNVPQISDDTKPSDEQVNKAKKVIQKLNIDFSCYNFENPVLQKQYASIHAMALMDEPQATEDYLQPDVKGMEKYKGIVKEFKDAVFPDSYDPEKAIKKKAPATKRKIEDVDNDDEAEKPAAKKRKIKKEEPADDSSDVKMEDATDDNKGKKPAKKKKADAADSDTEKVIDIVGLAKRDELGTLTLNELKAFLKQYNKPVSAKNKGELITRVKDLLREKKKIW